MNAIIGMAELLGDSPLSANQRKYVEIFKKSGESLLGIINDVLDISKIESGYLKINQEGCDLRECVKDVIELAKINIKNKNIYLASFVDPKLNTAILADTLRIQQVLLNIIGNGLKFTTIGGVLLTVKENLNTSHRGNILFTIRDTGMGIPSEHMTSLFSPFVQGDSSITKKFGGTGLGLALSKHLIEMMGGDIWVESEKDSGTVFYFTVQAEQAPDSLMGELKLLKDMADHSREIENEIVNISPLNILLVDDSEDNRLIAKAYLSNLNYHIVEAENGLEAIAKYKKEEFDLVFMDIQMPILDGVSATKEIRLFEKTSGKPRSIIVALTAYAQEDDEKRFLDIGCDIHLPKPIKKDVFQKVMRQALKLMQS
jgi:CheY-like chemotaxis protein